MAFKKETKEEYFARLRKAINNTRKIAFTEEEFDQIVKDRSK